MAQIRVGEFYGRSVSLAGSAAAVGRRDLGVSIAFRSAADGDLVVLDLADGWREPLDQLPPVRVPTAFKGQRNFAGSWWCATSGSHVEYESWLERDHLMLLDFAPDVVGISAQPCRLELQVGTGRRRHVPDYFVRLADGTGVLIDVRPEERVGKDADVFAATAAACELVGWRYERLGEIDPVFTANVRWLSGYRHRRCLDGRIRDALLSAASAEGSTVGSLAGEVGEPVVVLPTLFHLLWSGELHADLRASRLSLSSPIRRTLR